MEEGSFFCDDIRFSPSKIHIVKVTTKNLVAIKPLLSKDKVKLVNRGGKRILPIAYG